MNYDKSETVGIPLGCGSISVVIPVFNSEKIIAKTVQRVCKYLSQIGRVHEVILVNDGSMDGSWAVIADLAKANPAVTAVNLLRNYGQHTANLCGFRLVSGEYVVTLDDDLQNPPEEIDKLLGPTEDGYDLVIGRFQTKQHVLFRRLGTKLIGMLNRRIFGVEADLTLTNFRLIHRDVIERFCHGKHIKPYVPGLILQYSHRRTNVLVEHQPRAEGKSNYSLRKLLSLVAALLFVHSTIPLRVTAMLGFITSLVSLSLGAYFAYKAMSRGSVVPGWASLMVMLSFANGVLILLISVIGEYLIRILREVSPEEPYEVIEVVGQ